METIQRYLGVYGEPDDQLILRELPAEGDKPPRLVGYAAVFNKLSRDLGGFRERIKPGAFKRALASGQDVRALVDHNDEKVLGRTSAGTLRLAEDEIGLRMEVDVPDVSFARDLMVQVKRRDYRGMSFGAQAKQSGIRVVREDGGIVQELVDIDRLIEVTCTSKPAYEDTELMVRSEPKLLGTPPVDAGLVLRHRKLRLL